MLARGKQLVLHGDGKHTRRYLYAGDAVNAFDTILHKGSTGQVYNIGSNDEVSNLEICHRLLSEFNLAHSTPDAFRSWVVHSIDRPFNDRRYAVNGSKLQALGWRQDTAFDQGLKITVEWYRKFGDTWWGGIDNTLKPMPVFGDLTVSALSTPITPLKSPVKGPPRLSIAKDESNKNPLLAKFASVPASPSCVSPAFSPSISRVSEGIVN